MFTSHELPKRTKVFVTFFFLTNANKDMFLIDYFGSLTWNPQAAFWCFKIYLQKKEKKIYLLPCHISAVF